MRATEASIRAEMVASVLSLEVSEGDRVRVGQQVCLLESMKMEIPVLSEVEGEIAEVRVDVGDVVQEGDELFRVSV